MFYYISGTVALKTENFAVIDANGVGYKLYASAKPLKPSVMQVALQNCSHM